MRYEVLIKYGNKSRRDFFTSLEKAANHVFGICWRAHIMGVILVWDVFQHDGNNNSNHVAPWRVLDSVKV